MFHPLHYQHWSFTRAASLVPTNSRNRRWDLGLKCGYLRYSTCIRASGPSSTTPTCKVFCRSCAPTCFCHLLLSTGFRLQREVVWFFNVLQVHGKALFRNPAKAAEWQEGFHSHDSDTVTGKTQLSDYCFYCEVSQGLQRPAVFWESGKIHRLDSQDFGFVCTDDLASCQKGIVFGSDCRFHSFTQLSTPLNHGH